MPFDIELSNILKELRTLSTKRILLITVIVVPTLLVWLFSTSINTCIQDWLSDNQELVQVSDLDHAVRRLNSILVEFHADAVLLYVYQPSGPVKQYKERVYSASIDYVPEEYNTIIQLSASPIALADYMTKNYSIATPTTKHVISRELAGHDIAIAYMLPVYDTEHVVIADVIVMYKTIPICVNIDQLYNRAQLFMYDIILKK